MFRKHKIKIVYLCILILPAFLFFTQPNFLVPFKTIFIDFVSSPIKIISATVTLPLKEIKKLLYYHRTFEEYKHLRDEVDTLRARFIGMDDVMRENARLAQLLDIKRLAVYASVAANVIGREPSHWNSSLMIDKGEASGIKVGMPVVNALGVVGRIIEAGAKTSKVILLNDPQFSVAAIVQRTRDNGIVSGNLQGTCRLSYINEGADIHVGDKLVTSELSSSFPESLLIGEVSDIHLNARTGSLECGVKPAVTFSQIEEVIVILK